MSVRRSGRKRKSSIYNSSEYADLEEDEGGRDPGIPGLKKNKIPNSLFMEIRPSCQKLLTKMMTHEFAWPFNQPVDPVALNLPDYFAKISHPMDFSTIQKKMDSDSYKTSDEFCNDMRLVFNNCWMYNLPGSDIFIMANNLSAVFEKEFKKLKDKEAKISEDTEIEEMKSLVNDLKAEHSKLLGELQKLVKESQPSPPPPLLPHPMMNGNYGVPTLLEPPKKAVPKKKVQRKPRPPKPSKKKVYDLKEKEILSEKISKLSAENLQKMVMMVESEIPEEQKKNGELELDLQALSDSTIQKLDKFVENCLKNQEGQLQNRTIPAGEEHTLTNNTGSAPATNGTNGNEVKKDESSSESESDSSSSSSSDSESESEASEGEGKSKAQQPLQPPPPATEPQVQV